MRRGCRIGGCEQPHRARGFCVGHYNRWKRKNPGSNEFLVRGMITVCTIEGCDRPHCAGGLCKPHANRLYRRGETGSPTVPSGTRNPGIVSYGAAHARVAATRGKASDLRCDFCGDQAFDWAYDHEDPDEVSGDNYGSACVYSLDVLHYLPLCRPCHRWLDRRSAGRCLFEGCDRKHEARGRCKKHYLQWWRKRQSSETKNGEHV